MATERRVALITGGTDGIGKATAKRLLADGWAVVIVGRNPARCEATVAELRRSTGRDTISAIAAELSLMGETKRAAEAFLDGHDRLDFLFLNANAILHDRVVTAEGFETNFALGYLSRVLMAQMLEEVMAATPGSQTLAVVGMNKSRLDYDDLSYSKAFSAMEALGRWQWAMQLFARDWSVRSAVPMNIYMPGIVKTKILNSEPQPMKTIIKLIYLFKAIPVDRSAEHVVGVLHDVEERGRRGAYYSVGELKPLPELNEAASDAERLVSLTGRLLRPWDEPGDPQEAGRAET